MEITQAIAVQPTPAQSNRSEGFSFSTYLFCFAMAVVLYALSPGPIAKCARAAYGPTVPPFAARLAEIAYAPLTLCARHFPAVEHFYDWYMKDIWSLP
jgi:hypothetical protein